MIVYLDTSALVKLYVDEAYSKQVEQVAGKAEAVASHVLAFVEAHAAFARLFREEAMTENEFVALKSGFVSDWPNYFRIGSSPNIVERAANLAEAFALRAYDSVHLASAVYLQDSLKKKIQFGCFDRKLNQAARALGMQIVFDSSK